YSVPATGGELTKVLSIDGTIGNFAPSPDGKRIAFVGTLNGHPVRSYDQPDLFVTDSVPGATPKNLTAGYDYDINAGLSGDQRTPRGSLPSGVVWSKNAQSITVVTAERGRANLKRFDVASGKSENVTTGEQEVVSYTVSEGGRWAILVSTPTNIGDLF